MSAKKKIAVLATLDTKGAEAGFLKEQLERMGGEAYLVDLGVIGTPAVAADATREEVALAGGTALETLLEDPSRDAAAPVMVAGAIEILRTTMHAEVLIPFQVIGQEAHASLQGNQDAGVDQQVELHLVQNRSRLLQETRSQGLKHRGVRTYLIQIALVLGGRAQHSAHHVAEVIERAAWHDRVEVDDADRLA